MDFFTEKSYSDAHMKDSISFREVVEKYLRFFYWFVLSLLVFVVLAFLKIRYEIPLYKIEASILIKEKEKGNSFADLSAFEDLGLFGSGGDNSLENQIQILKSRNLMTKVVKEMELNTQYLLKDSRYNKELFPNYPFRLKFVSDSLDTNEINSSLDIIIESGNKFKIRGFDGVVKGRYSFDQNIRIDMGDEESSDFHTVRFELNGKLNENLIGETIVVEISSIKEVVRSYTERLVIEPVDERLSKVLILSLEESVVEKGVAVINNLIEQYNADGINDKNEIGQVTTDFLDLRIGLISTELAAIEGTAEQFKSSKGMINVNAGSSIYLETSAANESQLIEANTQMSLTDYMLDELLKNDNTKPLPGNIGLMDDSATLMIVEFNNLVLQRNRILKSSSIINPIIVGIDSQLDVLKNNLVSSLNNLRSSLEIQISSLKQQSGKINSRIASVPKNEREFKDIVRQQETKNALYLFLLQKREESILSNAVNVNKAKVIDSAYSFGNKVHPKSTIIYLGSIIFGLLIPFLIIYFKELLDTKVHDENDIRALGIPYLGDIPQAASKNELYVNSKSNSSVAEAFRYVRTNISFMLDSNSSAKSIFITSTQSHEGKTFVAINLASSLAISGKKTLLLGLDLRAPKISKYLNSDYQFGITNFIKNESLGLEDILITNVGVQNLDIINSGDIPPNPVEMLMSRRINELFERVKEDYDYIIVDTAPVGMVTDTIQINQFSDLTIYVIKANYLDKRMLHIPDRMNKENKLPNMAVIINGSDHSKGAYGYGYGYGEVKKEPWYKKASFFY